MSQIECKDISVKYENQVVLEDISFSIEQGDYLCIVGENGSGKSTLVKTILGLENPKTGKIVFGENLNKNEIGYLPQQTQAQKDFPASVYEVVLSGCLNSRGFNPFYSAKDKKLANDMIKSLGIEGIKKKSFRELSGGQQQRVLLARALCATKKIIILDEPITGLDPTVTREMYNLIKEINKKGITIIMVSHDINFAINNASKILHLKKNIKFFGNTEDYANSEVGRKFIGGAEID
ncbi:metal ABC transporter ATP-binding protein [Intestinibacter bartlettii]|uniref:Metal ABC transporter ATP-binding protein n=1 Tax=Intestinibacter bartlettii TaxID=261299 RepID=A0ABS6DVN7_9FIRM|nr:metal ABC transporter ATP-binding protein [Intestinibacter bartlettii]MBU5335810.1 metal ABC transporter ATP-binding protein [Intestinibacter bartlettii]MDO5010937.1 metal ABC transporter ATP-binding protein [Intestinibacter bartlettii]